MTPTPGLPYAHLNLRTNPFRELTPEERAALAVVEVGPCIARIRKHLRLPDAPRPLLVIQFLGPPGCGKTTHLDALRHRFPDAPRMGWSVPSPEGWAPGEERRSPPGQMRLPDGRLRITAMAGWACAGLLRASRRQQGPGRASARRPTAAGGNASDGWPAAIPSGELLFLDDAHAFPRERWPAVLEGRGVLVLASHRDLGPVLRSVAARLEPSPGPVDVRTVCVADRSSADHLRRIVHRRLEWARRGDGPVPKIDDARLVSLLTRHGPDLRAATDDLYRHIQSHPPVDP